MSQKIKTVIGNVLITDYCLYASILLICREEVINLINITRFIRARKTLAICAWLFVGTAKKCCQMLIGGSKGLTEESPFCYLFT